MVRAHECWNLQGQSSRLPLKSNLKVTAKSIFVFLSSAVSHVVNTLRDHFWLPISFIMEGHKKAQFACDRCCWCESKRKALFPSAESGNLSGRLSVHIWLWVEIKSWIKKEHLDCARPVCACLCCVLLRRREQCNILLMRFMIIRWGCGSGISHELQLFICRQL